MKIKILGDLKLGGIMSALNEMVRFQTDMNG